MPRTTPIAILFLLAAGPALAQAPAPAPAANPMAHDETRADAEARATAMHARFDLNHDGVITMDELATFAATRSAAPANGKLPPVPPMLKAMFDDGDADKDGKITLAEAKAAALRGFDEADTNHDGIVTPDERVAARNRVMQDGSPKTSVGR